MHCPATTYDYLFQLMLQVIVFWHVEVTMPCLIGTRKLASHDYKKSIADPLSVWRDSSL
jgi:hypothetical protein